MMRNFLFVLALLTLPQYSFAKKITAESWLVADKTGKIIEGENTKEVRSIASITKLMVAMVILDAEQDLEQYIKPYTRKELLQLAIVRSDNKASDTLCRNYPTGYDACINAMNNKAHKLGLKNTRFTDATGLNPSNVSTAEDLVQMVLAASKYDEIVAASKMSAVKIKIKKKYLIFPNTNPIIGKRHEFIVSKTGWIKASGGCIVMMLKTDIGERIVVVLGTKNIHTRIPEAEFIAQNF